MNNIDKLILRDRAENAFVNDNREKTIYALGYLIGYGTAANTISQAEFDLILIAREAFNSGDTIAYKQAIAKIYSMLND